MDTAEIFVLIGGVAAIGFTLWFFFGGKDDEAPAKVHRPGQKLYACPMHPWITSTNAGDNCSICGMKLVEKDS